MEETKHVEHALSSRASSSTEIKGSRRTSDDPAWTACVTAKPLPIPAETLGASILSLEEDSLTPVEAVTPVVVITLPRSVQSSTPFRVFLVGGDRRSEPKVRMSSKLGSHQRFSAIYGMCSKIDGSSNILCLKSQFCASKSNPTIRNLLESNDNTNGRLAYKLVQAGYPIHHTRFGF